MPLTENDLSHEEMKRIQQDPANVCAECGNALSICWGGLWGYESYLLRCVNDLEHSGYTRPGKQAAVYPGSHIGNIPTKRYHELEREGKMTSTALERYAGKRALTKADATDIVATLWPDAPQQDRAKAIAYCVSFQLNPLAKHLYLVEYKHRERDGSETSTWSILRSIQADRLIASRPGIDGRPRPYGYLADTPRAATEEEVKRQYGDAAEKLMKANYVGITQLKDGEGFTAIGVGLWPRDKVPKGTDKGNTSQNMANIRAERQALDRLRPGEMPQNIEVVDAEFEEVPDVGQVDTGTGEVMDPAADATPEPSEASTSVVSDTVRDPANDLPDTPVEATPEPEESEPELPGDEAPAEAPDRVVNEDEVAGLKALLREMYVEKDVSEEEQGKQAVAASRKLNAWLNKNGVDLKGRAPEGKSPNLGDLTYSEMVKVTDAVGAKQI